ncbi:MAG: type III secretion system export apparatus subunit SctR [Thiotrichales bacterium]
MDSLPNPIGLLIGLTILSLAPFVAVMVSSFLKIVVVIYILRNALGLQQVPPNLAINGLAIILSIYIMAPVFIEGYRTFVQYDVEVTDFKNPKLMEAAAESLTPLQRFLKKHSSETEREFFLTTTSKLWPEDMAASLGPDNLMVLLPSFTVSQLKSAFEVGFLLFLPFVVIDLIVSNILLSMGMIMLSPIMISMPFKILLFVMVDGWTRLIHGLVLSYQ